MWVWGISRIQLELAPTLTSGEPCDSHFRNSIQELSQTSKSFNAERGRVFLIGENLSRGSTRGRITEE
jgi:hypothetical protein